MNATKAGSPRTREDLSELPFTLTWTQYEETHPGLHYRGDWRYSEDGSATTHTPGDMVWFYFKGTEVRLFGSYGDGGIAKVSLGSGPPVEVDFGHWGADGSMVWGSGDLEYGMYPVYIECAGKGRDSFDPWDIRLNYVRVKGALLDDWGNPLP